MKDLKTDDQVLLKQYRENECATNRIVAIVSLVFVTICIFTECTLGLNYSIGIHDVNMYVFMPVCFLLVIFFVIALLRHYADPWIKYMLLSGIIFMSISSFFTYTVYMSYMVFLPVFISARYFNKKFMIQVAVSTLVLFLLACFLNLQLETKSEMMQLLHRNSGYNSWVHPLDAVLYIIAPMTFTFLFIAAHSINETNSGRRLLKSKAESVMRMAAVEAELNMASEIQRSALPETSFVTANGNFCIAAREVPAKEVGGDFYDYFMVNDHFLTALIADVSDKGAPAAMFMMSAKKAVQCAVQCCKDAESAIQLANKLICQDNKSGMFLTLWLCIIDTRSGVGKYINAGHPMPMLKHADGTVSFLTNDPDLFLGNFPDRSPKVHLFRIREGDTLLLYTDGLTDAMNVAGQSFGTDRLLSAVKDAKNDAQVLVDHVLKCADAFFEGSSQFDDMTLLALQCGRLDREERVRFEVNADEEGTKNVIEGVNALLEKVGCGDEKRRNAGVITDEVCANISEYAYEGKIGSMIVEATALSDFITLRFIDYGTAFNPLETNDPIFTEEPIFGGLGIFFVKNLADEMTYEREGEKNILTVTITWDV